ncbi:MAG TPA: hypothetical protein VK826_11225 [Bacteroidia bacterium]|nr:hypothetical protein [Bacteroidia bacterium]
MQDTLTFIVSYVVHEQQELVIPQNHLATTVTVRLYSMDMMIDGLYIIERPDPEPEKRKKK